MNENEQIRRFAGKITKVPKKIKEMPMEYILD